MLTAFKPPSVKTRGFRPKSFELNYYEMLALSGRGTTKFEQAVDTIAREMGIIFDAIQYYVPLNTMTSTIIDFVIFSPHRIAVFCDGPQHTLRAGTMEEDVVRRMELEAKGWKVVEILWDNFLIDMQGEVGKVLYA